MREIDGESFLNGKERKEEFSRPVLLNSWFALVAEKLIVSLLIASVLTASIGQPW